jgi:hypothetical protein
MTFLIDLGMEKTCPWLSQLKPFKSRETLHDYASMKEHLIQHYALMAMNKGSIDHARYMTRQLESEWAGLGISIAKRIKELRNDTR